MSQVHEDLVAPCGPNELIDTGSQDQLLRYAGDLARLQKLRRVYEHLLPDTLDPDSPELPAPLVREATALFSDIRGFTGISEALIDDPEALLGIVNVHMAAVVAAVMHCGGAIEKFIGDGVFATFGARREITDHAERALAAGMAIVASNQALNRHHAAGRGFSMEVGIGIATGNMVLGVIGSEQRAELGVLGDAVNVASRLVAAAEPGEILLSERAYEDAKHNIRPETVGQTSIRGRSGPICVYRISLRSPAGAHGRRGG